jgi:hypothetical protein
MPASPARAEKKTRANDAEDASGSEATKVGWGQVGWET